MDLALFTEQSSLETETDHKYNFASFFSAILSGANSGGSSPVPMEERERKSFFMPSVQLVEKYFLPT
jgi:hypothetical protein